MFGANKTHTHNSYVSPRKRAQLTFELLNLDLHEPLPWKRHGEAEEADKARTCSARVEVTEDVREWDYGDYEGITSTQIRAQRETEGIPGRWDIWKDGCPGGEYPADITTRLDRIIAQIREQYHSPALEAARRAKGSSAPAPNGDVLVVAHGHILRALAMRWVGASLEDGPTFLLEAGGVGTLR